MIFRRREGESPPDLGNCLAQDVLLPLGNDEGQLGNMGRNEIMDTASPIPDEAQQSFALPSLPHHH